MKPFTLWIEFEAVNLNAWHPEHQVCHVQVNLPDGQHCSLTVASLAYLDISPHGRYTHPRVPDLFVHSLSRNCIEAAVGDLLALDSPGHRFTPAPSSSGPAHSA